MIVLHEIMPVTQNATCTCDRIKCISQENIFLVVPANNLLFVFQCIHDEQAKTLMFLKSCPLNGARGTLKLHRSCAMSEDLT